MKHRFNDIPQNTDRLSQGKIIGILGQRHNGKSTLAFVLLEELLRAAEKGTLNPCCRGGYGTWSRAKLMDAPKRFLANLLGKPVSWVEAHRDDPPPPGWKWSIRETLIFLGEGLRKAYPNIWTDQVFCTWKNLVVDDLRLRSDLKALKERDGTTILVWRPGHENHLKVKTELEPAKFLPVHISHYRRTGEQGQLKLHPLVDFFLVNDGTKQKLRLLVRRHVIPYIFGPDAPLSKPLYVLSDAVQE